LPLAHAVHWLPALASKPSLHRKLIVFGVKAFAGGLAHITPAPIVYLPLAHAAHWLPALASKPALHSHSDAACAPTGDVRPPAQMSHALPPGIALNEPAGQAVQASGAPEKPALHWQVEVPEIRSVFRAHGPGFRRTNTKLPLDCGGQNWPFS